MSTYRYACKCMKCGVHFNVYSWSNDWYEKHDPFCPECGVKAIFLLDIEPMEGQIFEYVSATAPKGVT